MVPDPPGIRRSGPSGVPSRDLGQNVAAVNRDTGTEDGAMSQEAREVCDYDGSELISANACEAVQTCSAGVPLQSPQPTRQQGLRQLLLQQQLQVLQEMQALQQQHQQQLQQLLRHQQLQIRPSPSSDCPAGPPTVRSGGSCGSAERHASWLPSFTGVINPHVGVRRRTEVRNGRRCLLGKGVGHQRRPGLPDSSSSGSNNPMDRFGCDYCGWWHPNSPFPFPSCNFCGETPSYHHGRCCPLKPTRRSERERSPITEERLRPDQASPDPVPPHQMNEDVAWRAANAAIRWVPSDANISDGPSRRLDPITQINEAYRVDPAWPARYTVVCYVDDVMVMENVPLPSQQANTWQPEDEIEVDAFRLRPQEGGAQADGEGSKHPQSRQPAQLQRQGSHQGSRGGRASGRVRGRVGGALPAASP